MNLISIQMFVTGKIKIFVKSYSGQEKKKKQKTWNPNLRATYDNKYIELMV